MSQQALANAIGSHLSTINQIERGLHGMRVETARKIALALGVKIGELLG